MQAPRIPSLLAVALLAVGSGSAAWVGLSLASAPRAEAPAPPPVPAAVVIHARPARPEPERPTRQAAVTEVSTDVPRQVVRTPIEVAPPAPELDPAQLAPKRNEHTLVSFHCNWSETTFVYVDGGTLLGKTPLEQVSLRTGKHTVLFFCPALGTRSTLNIDLLPNSPRTVQPGLPDLPPAGTAEGAALPAPVRSRSVSGSG